MSMIDPKGSNPLSRRKSKSEIRYARQTGEASLRVLRTTQSKEKPVEAKIAFNYVK